MSEKTIEKNQPKPKLRSEMNAFQWTIRNMKVNWRGYVMVAPYFLIFLTFTVIPVVLSLILSFTSFNMLEAPKFLFVDNYIRLILDDDIFLLAIQNTLIFATKTPFGLTITRFL